MTQVSRTMTNGVERFVDENNQFHNTNDRPAVRYNDGTKMHYHHGTLHRDGDKPAVYNENTGDQQFYVNGRLHRDGDKPAVIQISRREVIDNNQTRTDLTVPPRTKTLTIKLYRWFQNGNLHRDNGLPAVVAFDGSVCEVQYYEDGQTVRSGGSFRGEQAAEAFEKFLGTYAVVEDEVDDLTPDQVEDTDDEPKPASTEDSTSEPSTTASSSEGEDSGSENDDDESLERVNSEGDSKESTSENVSKERRFLVNLLAVTKASQVKKLAEELELPLTDLHAKKFAAFVQGRDTLELEDLRDVKGFGDTSLNKLREALNS